MFIKRSFDIVFSILAIAILLPVIIFIAMLIYFKLGSPILFTQERVGKGGKAFKMVKFRTMLDLRDEHGNVLSDEKRSTAVGRLLRSLSLDELPELFNIVKGEMSIVGPRPLLKEYLPLYNEAQAKRHNVLPGLTGLAQVNGRNSISWNEKFQYDIWYVENWTLLLDIKIIFMTIVKVFNREGINQSEKETMEKFNGFN